MEKQVPFKKNITFDTNIAEINSISLEHEILTKKQNQITGKFIISGDYKMTETSMHLDDFKYELPFSINIDKKYNIDQTTIDISDFYYEIENNKILSVNIELTVDNIQETNQRETIQTKSENKIEKEQPTIQKETQETPKTTNKIKTLIGDLEEKDNYVTYKVHIVTENDTIESIIQSYEITKEKLNAYNELTEIKIGDKIIVPANEN